MRITHPIGWKGFLMSTTATEFEFQTIAIDKIHVKEGSIRLARTKDATKEKSKYFALAESIKAHGILTPIWVKPHPENEGEFILINGAQRLSIVRSLGWESVPCQVKDCDEEGFLDAQLHSNRTIDLCIADWVTYVQRKSEEVYNSTGNYPSLESIAKAANISKASLEKKLAIGRLPSDVVAAVDAKEIPATHAKRLADVYDKIPMVNFQTLLQLAKEKTDLAIFETQVTNALSLARSLKRQGHGVVAATTEPPFISRSKEQMKDEYIRTRASIDAIRKTLDPKVFADEPAFEAAVAEKVGAFKLGYFEALKFALSIDEATLRERSAKEEAQKRLRDSKKKAAESPETETETDSDE